LNRLPYYPGSFRAPSVFAYQQQGRLASIFRRHGKKMTIRRISPVPDRQTGADHVDCGPWPPVEQISCALAISAEPSLDQRRGDIFTRIATPSGATSRG
jgi:hypothetical protein